MTRSNVTVMSYTYTKLFSSILDSTVWTTPPSTKLVWITMLAMADRDGAVSASVPGLANRAGVPLKDAEDALATFMAPDTYSRTQDHEGRRISKVDGGWMLLNHEKYRYKSSADDLRSKAAKRQKRYRERHSEQKPGVTACVTKRNEPSQSLHSDTDTDTDTEAFEKPINSVHRSESELRDIHSFDAVTGKIDF